MQFKRRHLLLGFGIILLFVGAMLMSITISRVYWEFPPIGFYRYTTHPFTALGTAVASIGGFLIAAFVFLKVWSILTARRDARLKQEAEIKKAQEEAAVTMAAQMAEHGTDEGAEEFEDDPSQEPALSPEPEWQPPALNEVAESQQ